MNLHHLKPDIVNMRQLVLENPSSCGGHNGTYPLRQAIGKTTAHCHMLGTAMCTTRGNPPQDQEHLFSLQNLVLLLEREGAPLLGKLRQNPRQGKEGDLPGS